MKNNIEYPLYSNKECIINAKMRIGKNKISIQLLFNSEKENNTYYLSVAMDRGLKILNKQLKKNNHGHTNRN